jgi:SAM-dependent methyltransferase
MDIKEVQHQWNEFGKIDPLWAVLSFAGKEGNRWSHEEFFATGVQEIEGVLQDIEKLKLTIPPGRVLDFGCAVGRLTQALADHFPDVAGVDIAPSMLELGRQLNRHGDRCQYYLNGEDNLKQFPDATFAFILTLITLQHIQQRYAHNYLKEFLRLLKPGGVLVFQMPAEMTPEYRRRYRIRKLFPKSLYYFYRRVRYRMPRTEENREPVMQMYGTPRDEIVRLLEANGGEVCAVQQDESATNWISYRYYVRKAS